MLQSSRPDELVELPIQEKSNDPFVGLACGLREDRQQEDASKSTEMVLRAYYGKDSHRDFKRAASPRQTPQTKRPKVGPNYRQQAPEPVIQPQRRPFSGPSEQRNQRGAKASCVSIPRGRGGRSGRR